MTWSASRNRDGRTEARPPSGEGRATVDLPTWAGITDVHGTSRQLRLLDLGLPDLEQHIKKLGRHRDTYSKAIAVLRDLADAMREDPRLRRARDAFEKLGRAA